MTYSLGRLPEFDEQSRQYAARETLFSAAAPLKSRLWTRPGAWDQGAYPHCVGFACVGLLNTKPVASRVTPGKRWWKDGRLPSHVYREAQKVDYWPGEDYDGTSVLAGMKVLKRKGLIPEYRWAFGLDDTLRTISRHGPVVIGVNWYTGMFRTDSDGFVVPTGTNEGGHAVELHGINVSAGYVIGTNSWGRDWGEDGRFKLRFADLGQLLGEQGESVTTVLRGSKAKSMLDGVISWITGRI